MSAIRRRRSGPSWCAIRAIEHTNRDTFLNPAFTNPAGTLATFDYGIANPPFSHKEWRSEVWESDPWARAVFGLPLASYRDFAWIQLIVASMAEDSGRMAVVLPQGARFRKGAERRIRKALREHDLMEAVIELAPNSFYGTGLVPVVVTLRRAKRRERRGKDIMIDESILFREGRAQLFFDPSHAEQLVGWVRQFRDVEARAKVVSTEEIERESWTLTISRYVVPPIGERIPPLPEAAVAASQQALAEARAAEDRLRRVLVEDGWLE